jgi:hypothetical protein
VANDPTVESNGLGAKETLLCCMLPLKAIDIGNHHSRQWILMNIN